MGPTASGKTSLGVELAQRVGGEIINCDSVQIYKGIEIATAKPTDHEKGGIPHHLVDYVDPNVNYTAGDWARDAVSAIGEIESRGQIPILVGGTGFYLRSLMNPLFESPPTDVDLRERLRAIHRRRGAEHLYDVLARVDAASAERLQKRDHIRITRALEVYFQTGKKLSSVQPTRPKAPDFARRIRLFVLNPPRPELYERINERTESHFRNGLVDEVKHLRSKGVKDNTNALGAHAYRRVCEYLKGERDLPSAIEKSRQDVRNYAKRQLTWFRKEPNAIWLSGFGSEAAVQKELFALIDAEN
jgi:tRNA dimethylallyltransferase